MPFSFIYRWILYGKSCSYLLCPVFTWTQLSASEFLSTAGWGLIFWNCGVKSRFRPLHHPNSCWSSVHQLCGRNQPYSPPLFSKCWANTLKTMLVWAIMGYPERRAGCQNLSVLLLKFFFLAPNTLFWYFPKTLSDYKIVPVAFSLSTFFFKPRKGSASATRKIMRVLPKERWAYQFPFLSYFWKIEEEGRIGKLVYKSLKWCNKVPGS